MTTAILERLPISLTLTLAAFAIAVVLGVTLGLVAAYWHDTWVDRVVSVVAALGLSMPSFWLGICLIYLLPCAGGDAIRRLVGQRGSIRGDHSAHLPATGIRPALLVIV